MKIYNNKINEVEYEKLKCKNNNIKFFVDPSLKDKNLFKLSKEDLINLKQSKRYSDGSTYKNRIYVFSIKELLENGLITYNIIYYNKELNKLFMEDATTISYTQSKTNKYHDNLKTILQDFSYNYKHEYIENYKGKNEYLYNFITE